MKNCLPFLALTLCANLAVAEPPAPTATRTQRAATALVEKQVLAAFKKVEAKRSRFSRGTPPPVARRVRVLDTVARADARGKTFVRFAVDVRDRGDEPGSWNYNEVLGCAYPDEQEVFVQRYQSYLTADSLLGEDGDPQPVVCRPAPNADAQVARATRP